MSELSEETLGWLDMDEEERLLSPCFPAELQGGAEQEPPRMLMAGGRLYRDTGRESTLEARCGNGDGQVTSSVEPGETPGENGQSNFGEGYVWQAGMEEDTIEVNIDGHWWVFAAGTVG